jgi:TonB family protein
MRHSRRSLHWIAFLLCAVLFVSPRARADGLQQHLRDQYQGKTLLLRGFHADDKLRYDATGTLVGKSTPGDWTTDGVVLLNDIHLSGDRLTIKARRVLVSASQGTFHFLAENPKKQKRGLALRIEADLGSPNPSPEQAAALLSRIFLSPKDDFAALVPEYWKYCVADGLGGKNKNCRFSPEVAAIPGIASQVRSEPVADASNGSGSPPATLPESSAVKSADFTSGGMTRIGHGVSPPRVIYSPEPQFAEPARAAKYQGVLTLMLVVEKDGLPTNVHVVSPLGCGLDLKGVQAVRNWRFKPAEKDGQPVRVEIAVEVDFHLY